MKTNLRVLSHFLAATAMAGAITSASASTEPSSEPPPSPTPFVALTPPPGTTASSSPSPASSASPRTSSSPLTGGTPGAWDPFVDMQRMQTDMNAFFRRAMDEFNANPSFQALHSEPGFSSSLDVRDKGDHYEIHASLPGADINNVKVTSEGRNALRVAVSQSKQQKKSDKNSIESVTEFGQYEQLVTLPGPAKTKEFIVDRKEHEVVVTVPKAK